MSGADLISGVGCNATSAVFALLPLAKAGLIENARIECRVGSSEGGAEAKEGSSHSLRSRSLRVVSPFVHRHMAEVVQELGLAEKDISMTVNCRRACQGHPVHRACDPERKAQGGR
jgi:N-acetyl-gamma-glutamyl-phosphate/LysW-gamma-L-alpha-aminoadipyl-6-phosphate reductase